MLREIVEKLQSNEILCPEARELAKKIGTSDGVVVLKRNDGEEFFVDGGSGVVGGFIYAKNKKGKGVELDLCGNHTYKFA